MAPVEKNADRAVVTATSLPQHVALEYPVIVNGTRTIEGSGKREPFSESTKTILVLPRGTVVQLSIELADGQHVLLFNEKTKTEIACQVMKSKMAGSARRFVELRFTEPVDGFWGPHSSEESSARAEAAPVLTTAENTVVRPLAAAAGSRIPSPRPIPAMEAATQTNLAPQPSGVPAAPRTSPSQAGTAGAASTKPSAAGELLQRVSNSALVEFSKEIETIFAAARVQSSQHVPPANPTPNASAVPTPSMPSAEQLKLLATRLQAQLSSMHFTATSTTPPAQATSPTTPKPNPPRTEPPKTVHETPTTQSKSAFIREQKPTPPVSKPIPAALPVEPVSSVAKDSEKSYSASAFENAPLPQAHMYEEQSLSDSSVLPDQIVLALSKKAVSLGLVAVVLFALVVGFWRFRQNPAGASTVTTAGVTTTPFTAPDPTPPSHNSEVVLNHASSPFVLEEARASDRIARHAEPVEERAIERAKSVKENVVGDVHLAGPVIKRGVNSTQGGQGSPAIDIYSSSIGIDPLATAASGSRKEPKVPLPVGGDMKTAQLLKSVQPVYPPVARQQGLSGKVQLDAQIDEHGNVVAIKALSGSPVFYQAAEDAIKKWKYAPARLDGQPTSMHITVTIQFRRN